MRSKTKIIVLHLKELIYTGILLVLGVGLLFLLLQTFLPKKAVPKPDYDAETSLYLPGKYTSTVQLEDITYPDENRYTSQLLLQAIDAALQKATYPQT